MQLVGLKLGTREQGFFPLCIAVLCVLISGDHKTMEEEMIVHLRDVSPYQSGGIFGQIPKGL